MLKSTKRGDTTGGWSNTKPRPYKQGILTDDDILNKNWWKINKTTKIENWWLQKPKQSVKSTFVLICQNSIELCHQYNLDGSTSLIFRLKKKIIKSAFASHFVDIECPKLLTQTKKIKKYCVGRKYVSWTWELEHIFSSFISIYYWSDVFF
jgi:hypothetical protein